MLFSSITFIFYFIPIVFLLYFAVPKKLKNTVLLLSSLIFYGWGEPKFVILMIISIIQGYFFGILIAKFKNEGKIKLAKTFLAMTLTIDLASLCVFKYLDFLIESFNSIFGSSFNLFKISLPIGISFYTFQLISYAIDVYKDNTPPQKNIVNFGAYVSMFPQLIAGPIIRYSDINTELNSRKVTLSEASVGIRRFIIGLSKKVLIANVLGELTAEFKGTDEKSVLFAWIYAISYSLHVYFDFSGYSDMAIGLGKIMGFHFPENFNYPYISGSITEFWRRWHISLGKWFRDYLYIPMGGNRVSNIHWLFNILVVWMATGLWHGAAWNFVLWGLMFAVLLMAEKMFLLKYLKKSKVLNHIYVLFFVILSFIIFDHINVKDGFKAISQLFGMGEIPVFTELSVYYAKSYFFLIAAGIIGATPLPRNLISKLFTCSKFKYVLYIAEPVLLLILLAVSTAFLIDGSFNPFLYLRF